MDMLGRYELTGHLSSQNGGYSVWGFGKYNGRDYFIKQFLSPKYPANDNISSPERLEKKRKECRRFEEQKAAIYHYLNEHSDGNAVHVTEFFRIDTKYYITMPKIEALPWGVENVAALPEAEKRRLCAIIAHGMIGLHRGRIIHADLKHDNVLFTMTRANTVTAKIIDYDSGFLETAPPAPGEDIVGDLVYFSPEACLHTWGEAPALTCKMDIFSLGILFHQYLTGVLPHFDRTQFSYPCEAVAKGHPLALADNVPADLAPLLTAMLQADPEARPNAEYVYRVLARVFPEVAEDTPEPKREPEPEPEKPVAPPPPPPPPETPPANPASFFSKAGDL